MLSYLLINVKIPTVVGILTFMSRNIFMLSLVEIEVLLLPRGLCIFCVSPEYGISASVGVDVKFLSFRDLVC